MKLTCAFSFALFLGSMTLMAQSSGQKDTHPAIASVAQVGTDCPIDIQAQRRTGRGPTIALKNEQGKGIAQRLHLTLSNPKFAEITGLQITVHGFTSKARVSPTHTAQAESFDAKRSFDLKLHIDPKGNTSTDVWLPGFTSVGLIDLDSVTYADGVRWHSSASKSCHAVPDGAMLISSR